MNELEEVDIEKINILENVMHKIKDIQEKIDNSNPESVDVMIGELSNMFENPVLHIKDIDCERLLNMNNNEHRQYNKEHRKIELDILKKQVDIIEFLLWLGHKPVKWNYQRAWYNSPIREDDEKPSFCVYTDENKWWDFGINKGGSIIDLVMSYFDMDYVSAVKMLRKRYNHLLVR